MRTWISCATALLACAFAVAPAVSAHAAPAHAAPDCGPAGAADFAGFFDSRLPDRLDRANVSGAVVSVVSGDATVFARGYGLADREGGVRFDPDRSLVRIASITKLFTWTAVMQQVQSGLIDLDADVDRYLDFPIPKTYPEPITVLDLMNHTTGFEDYVIGSGARTEAGVRPLGEYLREAMPDRIRPPGEIAGYSNYGAGLAGYIVSRVSGEPYDAYVQRHVLDPLGMAHSTAAEPVPDPLRMDLAASYNSDDGHRVPFTFDAMPPDGSVSTTAADMARFMIAHLHDGRNLLDPATAALMYTRSYNADPRLGGYAHGFMDRTFNGHRVLMHDGSWEGFLSTMILIPDCHLGMFVSTNATGGADALADVIPAFLDRFAPGAPALPAGTPSALPAAAPQPGFYASIRHNESSVERLLMLLGPLPLTMDEGTVHFKGKDWTPVGDGLYRSADGRDHLAFLRGTHGERFVATDGPAYQLMDSADTLPVNLGVLLAFALLALTALLAVLWRLVRPPSTVHPAWRWARWLSAAAAGLGLVFLVLLILTLFGDTSDFLYSTPLSFRLLLVLPILALVLGVAAVVLTVRGWHGGGVAARIHQVAVLAGLVAFAWFAWRWNLIGWSA